MASQTTPGQASGFTGYGGIEEPDVYMQARYGQDQVCTEAFSLDRFPFFTQREMEKDVPNCVLASITRILSWNGILECPGVPADPFLIYPTIQYIARSFGYRPDGKGLWYELVEYPPWCLDNFLYASWTAFGYPHLSCKNQYFNKKSRLEKLLAQGIPSLFNISFGDYPGHTVTVCGVRKYARANGRGKERVLFEIADGWTDTPRYIDVQRMTFVPASLSFQREAAGVTTESDQ